jgi:hypothetical protein
VTRRSAQPERGRRPGRRPLVRIHDDALPSDLYLPIARAVRALGTRGLRRTYQTTFWFPLGPRTQPTNVVERAILALRYYLPKPFCRPLGPSLPPVGAEWWLSRMRTTDVQVDFHQDRDEILARRTGRLVHPVYSSVLFLNRCRGGLLAVTQEPANDDNPARAPDRFDCDLIRPAPNRFVWYPGQLTHGVLDARNRIPNGRLPGTAPLRLAVVVNFWDRRPTDVPTFGEGGAYHSLGISKARTVIASPTRRK